MSVDALNALASRGIKTPGMASISLEEHAKIVSDQLLSWRCLAQSLQLIHRFVSSEFLEDVWDVDAPRYEELAVEVSVHLASASKIECDGRASSCGPELKQVLALLTPLQCSVHIEALVMRTIVELTGNSGLRVEAPLMEAGVDSLAATELASRLREVTGVTLSSTIVFDHPTARAVAGHLLEQASGITDPSDSETAEMHDRTLEQHLELLSMVDFLPTFIAEGCEELKDMEFLSVLEMFELLHNDIGMDEEQTKSFMLDKIFLSNSIE